MKFDKFFILAVSLVLILSCGKKEESPSNPALAPAPSPAPTPAVQTAKENVTPEAAAPLKKKECYIRPLFYKHGASAGNISQWELILGDQSERVKVESHVSGTTIGLHSVKAQEAFDIVYARLKKAIAIGECEKSAKHCSVTTNGIAQIGRTTPEGHVDGFSVSYLNYNLTDYLTKLDEMNRDGVCYAGSLVSRNCTIVRLVNGIFENPAILAKEGSESIWYYPLDFNVLVDSYEQLVKMRYCEKRPYNKCEIVSRNGKTHLEVEEKRITKRESDPAKSQEYLKKLQDVGYCI